ncbi:programmed cell death protein 2 [Kockovaella imperatae]|uniref:Programmed cell death protein 2 n=1 Tax=Kockovaella imperatae TaxID=4999 RepID=A0A1Y1UGH8_9TREE|nr:programmed cell death protein 2 [Kockovaella imperatae]ORX37079.1 programmed cell death protein 2 [Kockovaella imperatae]
MSPSSPASSSSSLPSSNVLLALPDGAIPSGHEDAKSHTISTIGGYPTFPPLSSQDKAPEEIRCGICHQAIPLLAQVYCPPEDGENDRTVYVWACARSSCQRRDGSVRAYRASLRNDEYAIDAAAKRAAAAKAAEAERERARKNPFSMPASGDGKSLFGSAQPLFGAPPSADLSNPPDISSLSLQPNASTSHAPPLPAYQPPQYLTTIDEYLAPPEDVDMDDDEEDQMDLRNERWEQLLPKHMDEVFERYVKRLKDADGGAGQVLRYELGGVPVPYSSKSPLYSRLFPGAPITRTPDAEEEPDFADFYNPESLPPCSRCGAKRVFELQLVPSLISILSPDKLTTTGKAPSKKERKQSEEERKKDLARIAAGLKGQGDEQEIGDMNWGSILVFGCEADCVGVGEEFVAVEWESFLSETSE